MRLAKVLTEICTFCFALDKKEVAGPIAIPITLNVLESGGFTFYYDPASTEEDSRAFACSKHADTVTTMLEKFKNDVQVNIVDVVEKEENTEEEYEPGELPEGAEEFEAQADDDEEAPTVSPESKKLMDRIVTGAAGSKVTPTTNNPKPEDADPGALNPGGIEEWQTWYEDGYQPSTAQPKGDEKDACLAWWTPLPGRIKNELAPKGWPERGSLTRKTVLAWHMSKDYADFLATA